MISKIVICTINLTSNLNNVTSGVDSAIINLLHGFSKFPKKRVYVISFTKANSKIERYKSNIILIYLNFNFFKSSKLSFVSKAPFLFRKLISKIQPDIIHYQVHGIFLIIRLFLRKHKFKELNTFHGIYHLEAKINKDRKIESRINYLSNKLFLTKNAIFISKFSADSLTDYKFNQSLVIPNAINPMFNTKATLDCNNLEVLFVGLISPLKNLELIIESLRLIQNNIILKVYGSFKSTQYEKLILEKIDKYKLNDRIIFKGYISHNKMFSVLKNNNIIIVPSLHENLPMVIAESLAMNNIVIASNVGGISEMIVNRKTGFLIDPNSPKELSVLLDEIFSKKYNLKKIARNGNKFAQDNYLCDSIASKTINFYNLLSS